MNKLLTLFLVGLCVFLKPCQGECGEKVDIDLTKLSSTMVYSTVYNIVTHPGAYKGKTMKMAGTHTIYHTSLTDLSQVIHACIVRDAAGCCASGIEFQLANRNYPANSSEITVVGTIDSYRQSGNDICYLQNAKLIDS